MESAEITLRCPACGAQMLRREVVTQENGPRIELYKCEDNQCARKAALMYEPGGGLTEEGKSFVEREVARMGAFFPHEYTGSRRNRL